MRLNDEIHRREARSTTIGVVAFCLTFLACNAPSTEGLYGSSGSGSGMGGARAMGGSGDFGSGAGGVAVGSGGIGSLGGASGENGAGSPAVLDPLDASAPDAEVPSDGGIDAARSCGGVLVGAICWYLGEIGRAHV